MGAAGAQSSAGPGAPGGALSSLDPDPSMARPTSLDRSVLWAPPLLGDSRWPCGPEEASSVPPGGVSGGGRGGPLPAHGYTDGEEPRGIGFGGLSLGELEGSVQKPKGLRELDPSPSSHLCLPCRPRHQRRPGALQHRHQHPGGVHQQGGCLRPVSGPVTASAPPPAPPASTFHLAGLTRPHL